MVIIIIYSSLKHVFNEHHSIKNVSYKKYIKTSAAQYLIFDIFFHVSIFVKIVIKY